MKESKYKVKDTAEGQIDLMLLWRVFVGNLWKILLVGVLAAGLLGSFRYLTTPRTYTSNVEFLISGMTLTNINGEYTYIAQGGSASSAGSQFAANAPEIIGGGNTIGQVYSYLQTEDRKFNDEFTPKDLKELKKMLSVNVDSQIVTVSITHADRTVALEVAEAFRNIVPGQMDYYYGIENKYTSPETNGESASPAESETTADVWNDRDSQYENFKSIAKALNDVTDQGIVEHGRGSVLYAVIGFMLGAISVFVICFLRSYFDNTVYSEEDLTTHFTLPVVGQIPGWDSATETERSGYNTAASASDAGHGKKAAKKPAPKKKAPKKPIAKVGEAIRLESERDYSGRLLNAQTPFAITEAFKTLRTNMCYTTRGEKCPVYGITSAYVQAGKSLVIANLAVSFAMMDKKVLLLDGDLRCPVQHKVFNVSNRAHGFSDILAGICTYEDIELRDGGYPNLSILTCGKLPPNPAELLASENMKNFILRARQDYDFIFIDLPPVSEVSDAGIISELVTGFAFVVRAGHSDRRMVEMALDTMEGFGGSLTGFILNDIDIKSGNYYKNKYYSYGGKYGKYSKYSKYGRNAKYAAYGDYAAANNSQNNDSENS